MATKRTNGKLSAKKRRTLILTSLSKAIPSPSLGITHAQAAAVCLNSQGHRPKVALKIRKSKELPFELVFPAVTSKMSRAFNDDDEATEWGAAGIAILLVREQTGLVVVERSKKGTGVDYWMGASDSGDELPFQNKARLEASGLRKGSDRQIDARIKTKLEQTKRSDDTAIPAYVVVVEFGEPQAQIERR